MITLYLLLENKNKVIESRTDFDSVYFKIIQACLSSSKKERHWNIRIRDKFFQSVDNLMLLLFTVTFWVISNTNSPIKSIPNFVTQKYNTKFQDKLLAWKLVVGIISKLYVDRVILKHITSINLIAYNENSFVTHNSLFKWRSEWHKSKYALNIALRNTIKIQINKIEVISDKNFFNYPLETF